MNNKNKLQHLEAALETLKQQFQSDAVYSEEKLQELQRTAYDRHNKTEVFFCLGARDLVNVLQRKISEGYEYIDHDASVMQYQNGNIHLSLRNPEDVLQSELAKLQISTKEQYLSDVESAKDRLINQIAETHLQIKQTKKDIAAEDKFESEHAKEVARVQKELLGSAAVETEVTSNE